MNDAYLKHFIDINFDEIGYNKYRLKPKNLKLLDFNTIEDIQVKYKNENICNTNTIAELQKKYKVQLLLKQIKILEDECKKINE